MWDACHERFCPATVHPDTYRNPRRPPFTCAPIIAVVLDTPVGYPDFVLTWAAWAAQRLEEEDRLLRQLPNLPDLQCSWLLLPLIVTPRACDALRTVPPQDILAYTRAHDQAVWQTVKQWLWGAAEPEELHVRVLARLPACFGGLGLHFYCSQGSTAASRKVVWYGRVASSNTVAHCLASVRETRRRNASPVAMPRTPPSGLRKAVSRTMASAV